MLSLLKRSNLQKIMLVSFYSDYRGKLWIKKVDKKNSLLCTRSHCMQLEKYLGNLRLLRNVPLIWELHGARWHLRVYPPGPGQQQHSVHTKTGLPARGLGDAAAWISSLFRLALLSHSCVTTAIWLNVFVCFFYSF